MTKFPSPLGDEVLKPLREELGYSRSEFAKFPSPLGDEVLKPQKDTRTAKKIVAEFPSPLGDEVLKPSCSIKGYEQL